jgi:hypothetical protein
MCVTAQNEIDIQWEFKIAVARCLARKGGEKLCSWWLQIMDSGNAALTQIHLADFASRRTDALPFLVLGGPPPLVPNLDFNTRIDTPHAGIILLGPVDSTELAEALDAAPDPAIATRTSRGAHPAP